MNRNASRSWLQRKVSEFHRLCVITILNSSLGKSQSFWSALLIVPLLACLACSTAAPPPAVVTEIVERPDPTPPLPYPQPLALEMFSWTVMAPGHWRDPDQVYFCLEPQGYEAAARNNGQLLRFTKEVMWQLRYYHGEAQDDGMGRGHEGPDQRRSK